MRITRLGHAVVYVEGKKRVITDPRFSGNPVIAKKANEVDPDIILISHDHGDHGLEDAKIHVGRTRKNAKVVAIYELSLDFGKRGIGGNIGGTVDADGLKVSFTPALHSSSRAVPVGFIVHDETPYYFAGDTGIFKDMELYAKIFKPKLGILPVGGRFTMDPEEASIAAEMMNLEMVLPIHYNTFPVIKQDEEKIKEAFKSRGIEVLLLKPGESAEI